MSEIIIPLKNDVEGIQRREEQRRRDAEELRIEQLRRTERERKAPAEKLLTEQLNLWFANPDRPVESPHFLRNSLTADYYFELQRKSKNMGFFMRPGVFEGTECVSCLPFILK